MADAQVPPPTSNAYDVIYATNHDTLVRWRSHETDPSTFNASSAAYGIVCTYDGNFVAVARDTQNKPSTEVLDRDGGTVRVQDGWPRAIRPDGQRLMIETFTPTSTCEGTVDVDGTMANQRCFAAKEDRDVPLAYAPDGQTVLWEHDAYDSATTGTRTSLVLAAEDGSGAHEIVPANEPKSRVSAHFSFDGSRVTYIACMQLYDVVSCDIDVVDLATLEIRTLLHEPMQDWVGAVQLVPDSTRAVFVIGDETKPMWSALNTMDSSTSAVVTLVSDAHFDPSTAAFCVVRD